MLPSNCLLRTQLHHRIGVVRRAGGASPVASGGSVALGMITSTADLNPAWFTVLLQTSGDLADGVAVATAAVESFGSEASMMSSLVRVALTYDGETTAPDSLIVKLTSENEGMRFVAGMLNFYKREVTFYNEIQPKLSIDTPRCLHAEMYPGDQGFVLVLEEVVGARQVDQVEGMNFADATSSLEALANLHVPFWGTDLAEISETMLPFDSDQLKQVLPGKFSGEWAVVRPQLAERLPADIVDVLDRIDDILPAVMGDLMGSDTLIHTDCRSDNLLFHPDGRVIVLDFQMVAVGNAMFDPAYLISQSLDADAQARAQELIDLYLAKIASLGVDVDLEQAMTAYRASTIFNLGIPIALLATEDLHERAAELGHVMLDRAAQEILRTGAHLGYP